VREIKIATHSLPFILQAKVNNLILLLAINSRFHQKDLPSKANHPRVFDNILKVYICFNICLKFVLFGRYFANYLLILLEACNDKSSEI
jgi:hypothetical protein